MCVCVGVCVSTCWILATPCQHSLLHLSFIPSLTALHFHVYRLGLLVCILTISVWKPADSPALWAPQGRRFIGEGGVLLTTSVLMVQVCNISFWLCSHEADVRPLWLCRRLYPCFITQLHELNGAGYPACKLRRRGGAKHFWEEGPGFDSVKEDEWSFWCWVIVYNKSASLQHDSGLNSSQPTIPHGQEEFINCSLTIKNFEQDPRSQPPLTLSTLK